MKRQLCGIVLVLMLIGCQDSKEVLGPTGPLETQGFERGQSGRKIQGRFIVVLRANENPSEVAREHGIAADYEYTRVFRGFAGSIGEAARSGLLRDARVERIEPDGLVTADELETQSDATWGLDRVDQRVQPLDGSYNFVRTGAGTTVYVLDTGIRYSHTEFGGRAVFGFDAYGGDGSDCNGHGTHVAGTAGSGNYGVAKGVRLVSVRVLDCTATGTYSAVIAGLDWVIANGARPGVVNMSLGGTASERLDTAVQAVADAGFLPVVSAGNSSMDACLRSPARLPVAVTIGATDRSDEMASYSNHGSCIDWFAPGSGITSTSHTSTSATTSLSGTSMAAPHVSGAAALYLEGAPAASPVAVRDALYALSTKGIVSSSSSPNNHLLFTVDESMLPPPPENVAPRARFTESCVEATCTFTDLSTDSDGTIATWNWSFGDGATSTEQNPTHTFTVSGEYKVRLKIWDDYGDISTASMILNIVVPNAAPAVDFTNACADGACSFRDASEDADGSVVGWSWSFGDGGSSTVQNPTHTYAAAGDYLVRLAVTDDDGATASASRTISVTINAPNEAPSAGFTNTCSDLSCTFADQSTDADGTLSSWSWTFGDGTGSAVRNPTHTYSVSGDYLVRLVVTDDEGATATASNTVSVSVTASNVAPSARFTDSCSDATCSFSDLSSDADGSVVSWQWTFGDGSGSSSQHPNHTYTESGDYLVRLEVTDDDGATSTASKTVTVDVASISLGVTWEKVKGNRLVQLRWSGAGGSRVDIYRDGVRTRTVNNTGSYTDDLGKGGSISVRYRVCEEGTSACSAERIASF